MSNAPGYRQVWSYSLYGDNHEMYFRPLLEVIPLANRLGARVVINTPRSCCVAVKQYFHDYLDDFTVLVYEGPIAEASPKILRFLVPFRVASEFYFYKDSDSLVGTKELEVMAHWINSPDASSMIIRDHPQHVTPILAGMFGLARQEAFVVAESARDYFTKNRVGLNNYSYDQDWLMDQVYPSVRLSSQVYSSYFFYAEERVFRISRSRTGHTHIGAQCLQSIAATSYCRWCDSIYDDRMLCVPFIGMINRLFPRMIYGRVRPSLILAYLYSRVLRISNINRSVVISE